MEYLYFIYLFIPFYILGISLYSISVFDENINKSRHQDLYKKGLFYRIIGTNAVYHEDLLKREWYISTNVSGLFANVITRLHHGQSLSDLLDNRSIIDKMIKASKNEKGNDSTER